MSSSKGAEGAVGTMFFLKRSVFGLVLISLGLLWLAQSAGGYHLGLRFWPVVLTLVGAGIFWSAARHYSWFNMALGVWIGGAGVMDILHDSGMTRYDGGDVWGSGWPLLLVAAGMSMVFGKRMFRKTSFKISGDSSFIGDLRYGSGRPWRLDGDLNLDHGIGDVRLDLTTAEISEGVHNISVNSWIGDVQIRVPDNVSVQVEAHAGIGDVEVLNEHRQGIASSLTKNRVVPDGVAELRIYTRLGIGDLRVIEGPSAPRINLR